jgi:hypothetical protein
MAGQSIRNGEALAINPSSRFRIVYGCSIVLACGLALSYLPWLITLGTAVSLTALVAGITAGILLADLLSGLVHWSCDTWGSARTPWVGPALIKAFREHHTDPGSIVEHDWIEVNGEAALAACAGFICLAPLAAELAAVLPATELAFALGALWSLICVTGFANQLHKWAHSAHPPALVRRLQRAGAILAPARHARHHTAPHSTEYCIATGWLNAALDAAGFWRGLEKLVVTITGAKARQPEE